jgi:hypothetical protein
MVIRASAKADGQRVVAFHVVEEQEWQHGDRNQRPGAGRGYRGIPFRWTPRRLVAPVEGDGAGF